MTAPAMVAKLQPTEHTVTLGGGGKVKTYELLASQSREDRQERRHNPLSSEEERAYSPVEPALSVGVTTMHTANATRALTTDKRAP